RTTHMATSGPGMQNSGRGDRPATDMIIESPTHDLDLRQFRHDPHLPESATRLCGGALLNRSGRRTACPDLSMPGQTAISLVDAGPRPGTANRDVRVHGFLRPALRQCLSLPTR